MSPPPESPDYTPEDQSFWRETVMPALETLQETHPDNEDIQLLSMVIENRQFLNIRDFKIAVDGVSLRISPDETKESVQAKLGEFLERLTEQKDEENTYTEEDQDFWRNTIIPSLEELKTTHGGEAGFRFVTLMIERRMLTQSSKTTGLNISVGEIHLRTKPTDSKKVIQRKLATFLRVLKEKDSDEILESRMGETGGKMKKAMGKGWREVQEDKADLDEKYPFRYTPADQLFWREVVIPNLNTLVKSHPENPEVKALNEAIQSRQFLTTGDWDLTIAGATLNIQAGEDQDTKQAKLETFLIETLEESYTPEDQVFWRGTVMPALRKLQEAYPDDKGMKILVMSIEKRLLLKVRNLTINIGGVLLNITPKDSKKEVQDKLGEFLKELGESAQLEIIQTKMKLRIERLEYDLKRMTRREHEARDELRIRDGQFMDENKEKQTAQREARRLKTEVQRAEREARDARQEATRLRQSGQSSNRRSFYSSGE
jgi:hypothetical protein